MFMDRKFRVPRVWSNREIKKTASLFAGDVINVSGWKDEDKEGGHYKDYFTAAGSYTISNYGGFRGFQGGGGEVFLDLEKDLPKELEGAFDVVFNHTTLEHIYDIKKAFGNLCAISREVVILVVPFAQTQHETEDFKDYWRFTPTAVRKMFEENGLQTVYESVNNHFHAGIYVFAIAVRNPERWQGRFPEPEKIDDACWMLGSSCKEIIKRLFKG